MNPCHNRRKEIALLASNPSQSAQASTTHSHLDVCEGCRQYFAEVASLHGSHTAAALALPEAEVPAWVYRNVAAAIRIPTPSAMAKLARHVLDWRMPRVTAALTSVVVLMVLRPTPSPTVPPKVLAETFAPDDTRLSNYSRALAQSPEALDRLLTRSAANASTPSETSLHSWRNAPDYDL